MLDEPEVIRQQMHETRTALTEKIETLEQQVVETVTGAQAAVAETVENVKEVVEDTVEVVKDSVQDGIESVRRAFDVQQHFNEHPWIFVGGAVGVGYLCGSVLQPAVRHDESSHHGVNGHPPAAVGRTTNGFAGLKHNEVGEEPVPSVRSVPDDTGWLGSLAKQFSSEIDKVEALAIGVGVGIVRDLLTQAVPEQLRQQLGEVMDDITRKLGGETIREPILSAALNAEDANRRRS
jgi:ElaB/YqjD/DUF883 family membrane-anchored ribosome-binding protein